MTTPLCGRGEAAAPTGPTMGIDAMSAPAPIAPDISVGVGVAPSSPEGAEHAISDSVTTAGMGVGPADPVGGTSTIVGGATTASPAADSVGAGPTTVAGSGEGTAIVAGSGVGPSGPAGTALMVA